MANQQHVDFLLNTNSTQWNHWRRLFNTEIQLDFSYANLQGVDLSERDLSNTDFSNANLQGVYLMASRLCNANLSGANLTPLYYEGIKYTNIWTPKKSDLGHADLSGAKLDGAKLDGVKLFNTIMPDGRIERNY